MIKKYMKWFDAGVENTIWMIIHIGLSVKFDTDELRVYWILKINLI